MLTFALLVGGALLLAMADTLTVTAFLGTEGGGMEAGEGLGGGGAIGPGAGSVSHMTANVIMRLGSWLMQIYNGERLGCMEGDTDLQARVWPSQHQTFQPCPPSVLEGPVAEGGGTCRHTSNNAVMPRRTDSI